MKVLELTNLPTPMPSSCVKLVTSKLCVAVTLAVTHIDDVTGRHWPCLAAEVELVAMAE